MFSSDAFVAVAVIIIMTKDYVMRLQTLLTYRTLIARVSLLNIEVLLTVDKSSQRENFQN